MHNCSVHTPCFHTNLRFPICSCSHQQCINYSATGLIIENVNFILVLSSAFQAWQKSKGASTKTFHSLNSPIESNLCQLLGIPPHTTLPYIFIVQSHRYSFCFSISLRLCMFLPSVEGREKEG